jgi:hypothetical protein
MLDADLAVYTRRAATDAVTKSGCGNEGPFIGFRCARSLDVVAPLPEGR